MSIEVSSLLRAISEANQALEREPTMQARISELEQQHVKDGEHIAALEIRIHSLRDQISQLNAEIREVEKERDDYGFRHMASEDKATALASVLKNVHRDVAAILKAQEPVEEVILPPVVPPTPAPVDSTTTGTTPQVVQSNTEGQSASGPTDTSTSGAGTTTGSEPHTSSDKPNWWRERQEDGKFLPEPRPIGPFTGKKWWQVSGTITKEEWLEGGGAEEDWRQAS